MRGLAEFVFLRADGVCLAVGGQGFLSLLASIVIAERDRVVVTALDAAQHSAVAVVGECVGVGLASQRAGGMADVDSGEHRFLCYRLRPVSSLFGRRPQLLAEAEFVFGVDVHHGGFRCSAAVSDMPAGKCFALPCRVSEFKE